MCTYASDMFESNCCPTVQHVERRRGCKTLKQAVDGVETGRTIMTYWLLLVKFNEQRHVTSAV